MRGCNGEGESERVSKGEVRVRVTGEREDQT